MDVIGEGSIGDKAKQLDEKSELIAGLGFRQSEQVVLAQGFLDSILRSNGLASNLAELESHPDFSNWVRFGEIQDKLYGCVT
jgi:hypothetical protein